MGKKYFFLMLICLLAFNQHELTANDAQETEEASLLQQIFTLKQLKPDIKKIAILCQAKNHIEIEQQLGRLQKQTQLEFVLYDIKKLPDVAKSVKDATTFKDVQVLWIFADEILLDSKTQSYLINQSMHAKLFLLSVDQEMVKKGGTASVRKGASKPVIFLNQKAMELLAISVPVDLTESVEIIKF